MVRWKIEKGLAAFVACGGALLDGIYAATSGLTFWAWYWLFVFFGMFLIPELYWVRVKAANTVSDNTWRFESLNHAHPFEFAQWTWVHWSFALVYLVFAIWLGLHLVFGMFG